MHCDIRGIVMPRALIRYSVRNIWPNRSMQKTYTQIGFQCFYVFIFTRIGVARRPKGPCPPKFLENMVILCFERRFSKQNRVIRLKSNILVPQIFGLAAPLFTRTIIVTSETHHEPSWMAHEPPPGFKNPGKETSVLTDVRRNMEKRAQILNRNFVNFAPCSSYQNNAAFSSINCRF